MLIDNGQPRKEHEQGQSSVHSFVRGGRITSQFLNMFVLVMRRVAGVSLMAVAATVSHRFSVDRERQTHGAEVVTHDILNRLLHELGIGDG